MTVQETINLTPFERVHLTVAEFGENCVQSSMWHGMAEKLAELEGKEDPESVTARLLIENFLSTSIQEIPALVTVEA